MRCVAIGGAHLLVALYGPATFSWANLALGYLSYAAVGMVGITLG